MTVQISFSDRLTDIYYQTSLILKSLEKYSETDFFNDEFCQNGFIRSLEIIGEASKKIPNDFRLQYPQIQWRGMAGLRDVLIHNYGVIDPKEVWHVITVLIPQLNDQIASVLKELEL